MIQMALEKRIEYLMDASTLRHFMSDPWPYRKQRFVVKLVVFRKDHRGGTRHPVPLCFHYFEYRKQPTHLQFLQANPDVLS